MNFCNQFISVSVSYKGISNVRCMIADAGVAIEPVIFMVNQAVSYKTLICYAALSSRRTLAVRYGLKARLY